MLLYYSVYLVRAVVSMMVAVFLIYVRTDSFIATKYLYAHVGVAIAALLDFCMDIWACWMIARGVDYFAFHWVWLVVYYVEWTMLGFCILKMIGSRHTFYWFPPLLIYYVFADSREYRRQVDNNFAGTRNERLHELSYCSPTFYLIYLVLTLADLLILSNSKLDAAVVALSTLAVVWITLKIFNLKPEEGEIMTDGGMGSSDCGPVDGVIGSCAPEIIDPDNIAKRVKAWESRADKPYCDEMVSLVSVANDLRVSPRTLSSYINFVRMVNFNTWINGLRVEEIKRIISEDPHVDQFDLMASTGFQSRSSLSRAMRNFTGMTLTEFRKMGQP